MITSNHVALDVLTDHSLLATINAFSPGLEDAVDQLREKLVCASDEYDYLDAPYAQDVELWRRAICVGDKPTLMAFRALSETPDMENEILEVLRDSMSYPALLTKDLALLDWIADRFDYSDIYQHSPLPDIVCRTLGEQGDVEVVKWVSRYYDVFDDAVCGAASKGHVELVKFFLDDEEYFECGEDLIKAAIESDQLSMLEYALENKPKCRHDNACENPADISYAAKVGALGAVQFLLERRPTACTTDAMDEAAANGHLAVVKFLHENRREGCTTKTMDQAATNGHLDVVQFLHDNRQEGCTTEAMNGAAANGHLPVVKFLHDNRHEGCTGDAIDQAAKRKHFYVASFLRAERQQGCSSDAIVRAIKEKDVEVFSLKCEYRGEGALEEVLQFAADGDGLSTFTEMFKSAPRKFRLSPLLTEDIVNLAVTKSFFSLVWFFHSHNFFRCTPAAIANQLKALKALNLNRATESCCKVETPSECRKRKHEKI